MKNVEIRYSRLKSCEIPVHGYKHAATVIIMASIIARRRLTLYNVPRIEDISILTECVKLLNGHAEFIAPGILVLDTSKIKYCEIPDVLTEKIHSSIYFIPTLSTVFGRVTIGKTGGCQIGEKTLTGNRPIHHMIDILKFFGGKSREIDNSMIIEFEYLPKACEIDIMNFSDSKNILTGPLVSGATKTAILAALSVEDGETIIKNPYLQGDVQELISFIKVLGCQVQFDNHLIKIKSSRENIKELNYTIMSDVTELITYIACSVYNKIPLKLINLTTQRLIMNMKYDLELLERMNIKLIWEKDSLYIPVSSIINNVDITITSNTILSDHQPFYCLMLLEGKGKSRIKEEVWKKRFSYADELKKIGAKLIVEDDHIEIFPSKIDRTGQILSAGDLRAAAVLVIASLKIEGTTYILGVDHLKRGYENFYENLQLLGADIKVVDS